MTWFFTRAIRDIDIDFLNNVLQWLFESMTWMFLFFFFFERTIRGSIKDILKHIYKDYQRNQHEFCKQIFTKDHQRNQHECFKVFFTRTIRGTNVDFVKNYLARTIKKINMNVLKNFYKDYQRHERGFLKEFFTRTIRGIDLLFCVIFIKKNCTRTRIFLTWTWNFWSIFNKDVDFLKDL